jgi:AcrR family transcriptional regulator
VGDLKASLLRAAGVLLTEGGPKALTVRGLAAAAGCSTMIVYSGFGGKEGVLDALYAEGFSHLSAALDAVPVTDDPVADLYQCAEVYRTFARDHRTYYAVMFDRAVPDFEPSDPSRAMALGALDALTVRVKRAIDLGAARPVDARMLAACLWAAMHGMVSLELAEVSPTDLEWSDLQLFMADTLLHGLAPGDRPA